MLNNNWPVYRAQRMRPFKAEFSSLSGGRYDVNSGSKHRGEYILQKQQGRANHVCYIPKNAEKSGLSNAPIHDVIACK